MARPLKYTAAIFDLWGTLVPSNPWHRHHEIVAQMAERLGADLATFDRWFNEETRIDREAGRFASIAENVRWVLDKIEHPSSEQDIAAAAKIRLEFVRSILVPRPGAIETLEQLEEMGVRLGLISDCSPEVPEIWPSTDLSAYFKVALFSSQERQTKPHPDLYLRASSTMGVEPTQVVYVGDGGSYELSGAERVGMHAILLDPPDQRFGGEFRPESATWSGPVIEELSQLVEIVAIGTL